MKALVLILALALLTGCQWLAPIAQPVQPLDSRTAGPLILEMAAQHDESVGRDPVLVDAEKTQALRMSEQVRAMVQAAMGAE